MNGSKKPGQVTGLHARPGRAMNSTRSHGW
jgi:hypothetical protein